MARFLLSAPDWLTEPALLTGDEARHLGQVLRLGPGARVTVFDGCGRRAAAEVLGVARDRVTLRLGAVEQVPPLRPAITLVQAIPKGKHMDIIVQKAVELGVAAIQPLVTSRTVVHPGEGKSDKWRRIALEACKQCGQDTLPRLADPQPFARWIASQAAAPCDLRIIASLAEGARPLREILRAHPAVTAVTLLVGPEGDFSAEETTAALAAGFLPASLGEIVLRVETAALFGLAALRYEFA